MGSSLLPSSLPVVVPLLLVLLLGGSCISAFVLAPGAPAGRSRSCTQAAAAAAAAELELSFSERGLDASDLCLSTYEGAKKEGDSILAGEALLAYMRSVTGGNYLTHDAKTTDTNANRKVWKQFGGEVMTLIPEEAAREGSLGRYYLLVQPARPGPSVTHSLSPVFSFSFLF
jgi:hypothetical protein